MTSSKDERRLYQLFAELLDYPTDRLAAAAEECLRELSDGDPQAASQLQEFAAFAAGESLGGLEEVYTRAFDITPTTTLYVGYQVFGESYKRGAFLAKLQEAYLKHGFSPGVELADHLCVLLRFACAVDDPEFVDPLIEEAIRPALVKVEEAFKGSKAGYALAVSALTDVIGSRVKGQGSNREDVEEGTSTTVGSPFSPFPLLPFSPPNLAPCPLTLDPTHGRSNCD